MKKQLQEALSLSSGTIASLTGLRKYEEIDNIHSKFIVFIEKSNCLFETWMEAWKQFLRYK